MNLLELAAELQAKQTPTAPKMAYVIRPSAPVALTDIKPVTPQIEAPKGFTPLGKRVEKIATKTKKRPAMSFKDLPGPKTVSMPKPPKQTDKAMAYTDPDDDDLLNMRLEAIQGTEDLEIKASVPDAPESAKDKWTKRFESNYASWQPEEKKPDEGHFEKVWSERFGKMQQKWVPKDKNRHKAPTPGATTAPVLPLFGQNQLTLF